MSGPIWWVIWPVSWLSADAAVEARRAEPERRAIGGVGHLPDPDVMAAVGAFADRLFESEILLAAVKQQGADRRVGIGPIEDHAFADLQAGAPGDRVGRMPARDGESMDELDLGADEADIDRIAGYAVDRGGDHLVGQRDVAAIPEPPDIPAQACRR